MKTIRRRWTLLFVAGMLAATIFGADTSAGPKNNGTEEWEARGKAYAHLMRSTLAGRHGELKRAADEIQAAVGDGSALGVSVTYIRQEAPLGLAHAVTIAEPLLDGYSFVVHLVDNFINDGITSLVRVFDAHNPNS